MKKYKLLACLALSSLLMTSCSTNDASANITNPDDPIIEGVTVDGNTLKDIYDTIKNGDSYTSDVKTMLTYEISKNYFGTYELSTSGEISLKEYDGKSNSEKVDFIKKHKAYWNWNAAGIRVTFEDAESVTEANLPSYETRIQSFKDLIKKQIVTKLFTNISSGTYSKNNRFFEILYAKELMDGINIVYKKDGTTELSREQMFADTRALSNENYNLEGYTPTEGSYLKTGEFAEGIIIGSNYDVNKSIDNIINGDTALIHLGHYVDYVNNTMLPDIVNNLLTEQYILENQYSAIGRTQQRKIEVLSVEDNDSKRAYTLLREFFKQYASSLTSTDINFDIATNAWKGIYDDLETEQNALSKSIATATFGAATSEWQNNKVDIEKNPSYIDGKANNYYKYYKNSKYGELIKSYSTLTDNPSTNDTTNYTSFTSINSKSYLPEEGKNIKLDGIRAEDYINYRWGTKTDFSDLSDDAKTKLFSYSIISEIDRVKDATSAVNWQYLRTFQPGGVSFLKKDGGDLLYPYDSVIWSNADKTKYSVIAVYDYISPSTTTSGTDTTPEELNEIESIAREAGYTIASGTTYTTDALEYYVDNSNLTFFDQKVYDYFVEQFPDIF